MTIRFRPQTPSDTSTEGKYLRAADALDRANRIADHAARIMLDADDMAFDQARRELARAEAGVRYAALVLRCQAADLEATG